MLFPHTKAITLSAMHDFLLNSGSAFLFIFKLVSTIFVEMSFNIEQYKRCNHWLKQKQLNWVTYRTLRIRYYRGHGHKLSQRNFSLSSSLTRSPLASLVLMLNQFCDEWSIKSSIKPFSISTSVSEPLRHFLFCHQIHITIARSVFKNNPCQNGRAGGRETEIQKGLP